MVLTFFLIMFGAYVRLTDAGLGCPDWPGCYGELTPHHAKEEIAAAVQAQGGEHGPVSQGKAWREMGHRYVAAILGLLIIGLAVLGWRWRRELPGGPWLATILVGVVILQGLFGKWTVTLLLKPAIVTGHLIGGMLTLALLVWLWQRQAAPGGLPREVARLWPLALAGLVALSAQIVLGGWVSTNYAALACTDFPTCHGQWWPKANWEHAFHVIRPLGMTKTGEFISAEALVAMHLSHRVGFLVAAAALIALGVAAMRRPEVATLGAALLAALALQTSLGIGNVLLSLPLWMATAHNGGAALLITIITMLIFRLTRAGKGGRSATVA